MTDTALLDQFHELTGLPLCLCTGSGETLHYCPGFPRLPMSRNYLSYCVMDFSLQKRDEDHPLVLVFEPGYFLGIARLAEDAWLLLGPAGPQRPRREAVLDMCREVIVPDLLLSFCDLLSGVPTYSYRRFSMALSLAIRLYAGRSVPLEDILLCNNTLHQNTVEQGWQDTLFHAREQEEPARHTAVSFETGILEAIEHGDPAELRRRFLQPAGGSEGLMSMDLLRQSKYTFVSFVTMVTRAAIRGGMPPEEAFSLSDSYCQQMDRLMSPADVGALSYKMAIDFCGKVGQLSMTGKRSSELRRCLDYIGQNLHRPIRAEELAEYSGVSVRSLSARFRRELGMSIPAYIQGERLREAAYLLAASAHSLSEISAYLQFSSQSYFTKCFRERFGCTPNQFRKRGGAQYTLDPRSDRLPKRLGRRQQGNEG